MPTFISYSQEDEGAYASLCLELKKHEIEYWDTQSMTAGAPLRDQLRDAINKCDMCIFLATQNSVGSRWCLAEIGAFWGAGKKVVVYLTDPALKNEIPPQLRTDVWAHDVPEVVRTIKAETDSNPINNIVGEWRSKYRLTAEMSHPLAEEDIDVTACQGGVCITSKENTQNDSYTAQGNLVEERFLMGKWKATQSRGATNGVFLLTINPRRNMMYGYATGQDERSATIYVSWVLAKKVGSSEDEINQHLKRGEELLRDTLLIESIPIKSS